MTSPSLIAYDVAAATAATPIFFFGAKDDIPEQAPDALAALAAANAFRGEAGAVIAHADGVLLGVGDGGDALVSAAAAEKLPAGDYYFADNGAINSAARSEPRHTALGWLLGTYRFTKYKSAPSPAARLVAPEGVDVAAVSRAYDAVRRVRDLVNTPAGDMLPDGLEACAREIAQTHGGDINVTVGDALIAENFPMIHAVGRASDVAPRLIDLVWGDAKAPKVTLVGKGVCFDSGGLNIKGAGGMGLMKKDMGGAAHVLALGAMIMAAGLNVRLRVLVPAVENAISGNAFRPGDVLPTRKGLTVEIGNTDAEGRLVLSDALSLACEEKPDLLISLATLTGAARIAVGPELAPFYTDDNALAEAISREGAREADPVWRMPLWRPYDAMLSSSIADCNNISSNAFAGSVIAALFLNRFVEEGARWAHFDIYAWRPKAAPGRPVGGEAQAIRALFNVIADIAD